jgi:hypothetical protein
VAARRRTERRALERDVKKQIERRDKLAALSPGGAPERPITVVTAAVIEPTARASRCARCDGGVRVEEHTVRGDLRVVAVRCVECGSARELYFRIEHAN